MTSRWNFISFIMKNKGFAYFFKKYLLQSFLRILYFGPFYIGLRSIEFCLPVEQKRKYTLPTYLQLEPTSRCNMKCRNCTRDTLSQFGDLEFDDFSYILKQFPFLQKVKLQGLGEPLLNNSLFKMASFLKNKRITTYIATNGTLITKPIASDMVKYFDKIEVSIDAADRKLLREIRGRDCWDEVMRGARLLKSVNKDSELAINFVLEKANASELPSMINLADDLDIRHINVVGLQSWVKAESRYKNKRNQTIARTAELGSNSNNYLKKAMALAESRNIYLDSSIPGDQKAGCFWPKRGVYISWNGYVSPCCIRPNYEEFNFGNVFKRNISYIWNSPEYVAFREKLNVGEVPDLCKGCSYA